MAPLSTTGARRYTFLRRLAVGGMGELLLARAAAPGGVQKLVAIKRVRSEYASDPEFLAMFLNEARLGATLDHPNIVRTYDLVEEAGAFFMVMEYLHGESLGRVLNAVSALDERVPLEHVVTIVMGVAAGLHSAHDRSGVDGRPLDIVHRDLSPGNVFVTYEGGVKLLDFGIAKATSRTSITIGPSRKGKVSYMSPEQCVGDNVDRRSDVFGLGVVMWELSTGKRLFKGDNEFAIMNQVTTKDAPSPREAAPELPTEFEAIVLRALARDPKDRFQSAMELHDAVEAFAFAHGLLPSGPALGRYLTKTCGFREFPSAEATEEFMGVEQTLVVHTSAKRTRGPRLSLFLALAGGASLGAIAVSASSTDPAPVVTPAPATANAEVEPAPVAAPQDPPTPDAGPTPEPPAIADPSEAPITPPPAAESATEGAADPATPVAATGRKKKPKKKDTVVTKPAELGPDGILPRG